MNDVRVSRRDDGMTLPELIISITILAFIMGTIAFALIVALRNTAANQERVSAGGGAQLLSAWFTSDVQSASTSATPVTADVPTGCPGDQGTNKLLLRRSDGGPNVISYRLVPDGAEYQIWRVVCDGTSSVRNILAFGIVDPTTVHVTVAMQTKADSTQEWSAVRLDADVGRAGVDPVKLVVVGTPRTRSAELTPVRCAFVSAVPQSVVISGDGRPANDVTFELAVNGDCGTLAVSIPTGGTPATLMPSVTGSGNIRTATVAAGPTTWSLAMQTPRTVTVTNDGAPLATFPLFVVPAPCTYVSGSASRTSANTDFSARLTGNVPISIMTTGYCQTLTLQIATGGAPDPFVSSQLTGGPFTWSTTIPRPGLTWTDGAHGATVLDGSDTVGSFTFTTQRICSMTSNSATPVVLDGAGRAALPVMYSVTTVGDCTAVSLSIDTDNGPLADLPLGLSGGPTWTRTSANGQWTAGSRLVTVLGTSALSGQATLGTFTVTALQPACVVRSVDDHIGVSGSSNKVFAGETISFDTSGPCGPTMKVRFSPPGGAFQSVDATPSSGQWETGNLGGTDWTDHQPGLVYVYNSTTTFDNTTLAGVFEVLAQ